MVAVTRRLPGQVTTDAEAIGDSLREPETFALIFDRYYDQIHGYASRRLGPGVADDVAAETFTVAFAARERYDLSRPDCRPWLYGIASNLVSRHGRAEVRQYRALARAGVHEATDGEADRIASQVDARAHRGPLARALSELSDGDRDVLLLVAWAELTPVQAADALGIPAGTACSRLHRARNRIRTALGRHEEIHQEEEH
jgi:RNA polymerase sigma-70 factor (ECF subfamily)